MASPMQRRARVLRNVRGLAVGVVAAGVFLAVGLFAAVPGEVADQQLAVRLVADGQRQVVDRAELIRRPSAGRSDFDPRIDVEVGFVADGAEVTTLLIGPDPQHVPDDAGRYPATAESGYGEPLEIAYLPQDPRRAIAVRDLQVVADAGQVMGTRVLAVLGLVPLVAAVATWLLRGRPPWWNYFRSVGCALCPHLRDDHDAVGSRACRRVPCGCPGLVR
ncbi:hypothetical protein ASD16_20710 [Cellulomonas sp. Root485]|uniref:hypothetical protein n=1 Tax=Cellulomonas sp. Root485 TaxID=1736546 RepID=UPI0007014D78|nr:hypothetical protein [Cellulomonas sp. Root485]KQY20712.1 hypothetical protein ASD16_20710 [Cellulomonas sp. Root485]